MPPRLPRTAARPAWCRTRAGAGGACRPGRAGTIRMVPSGAVLEAPRLERGAGAGPGGAGARAGGQRPGHERPGPVVDRDPPPHLEGPPAGPAPVGKTRTLNEVTEAPPVEVTGTSRSPPHHRKNSPGSARLLVRLCGRAAG